MVTETVAQVEDEVNSLKRPKCDSQEDDGSQEKSEAPTAKRQKTEGASVDGEGSNSEICPKVSEAAAAPSVAKHVPVTVVPTDPLKLQEAVCHQIEYYFTDENMKHDEFFQKKISEDPEGWLNAEWILSCRNVKRLAVTSTDAIFESLVCSKLLTKKDEAGRVWVKRSSPLPSLEPRKKPRSKKDPKLVDMKTFHDVGCIVKASGCPEEAGWFAVKTALNEKLADNPKLRFASQLQQDGTCYAYVNKFEGDLAFFEKGLSLSINGADVSVSLCTDPVEATNVIKNVFPNFITEQRERSLKQMHGISKSGGGKKHQKKGVGQPLTLAGTDFNSVTHLRSCVRELLQKSIINEPLKRDQKAFNVVHELLKYHPNPEKSKGLVDIKVATVEKNGDTTKCFHIIRDNGDVEDFSFLKCIAALEKNPPLKQQATNGDNSTKQQTCLADISDKDTTAEVAHEEASSPAAPTAASCDQGAAA